MQKVIKFVFRFLGVFAPALGGSLSFYLFFKPFRLKSHPKDLAKKLEGKKIPLTVNGNRCYAWVWGKGPTIIFAHGWSSKGFHFRKFIEPLTKGGYKVVIPDFPGHVSSEGKSSNVLEFKETILSLSQELGDVYALVGHSLGAMACILALNENSLVVEKLVVSNSAINADTIMNRFMEQIGGNKKIEQALRKRLKKRFNQDFSYYSTANLVKEIANVPQTLVVVDNDDPEVPVNEGIEMSKLMNGELLTTFGMGHNNGLKDDKTVEEIISFLTKKNRVSPVSL